MIRFNKCLVTVRRLDLARNDELMDTNKCKRIGRRGQRKGARAIQERRRKGVEGAATSDKCGIRTQDGWNGRYRIIRGVGDDG